MWSHVSKWLRWLSTQAVWLLAGPLDTALAWAHTTTHLREIKSEWLAGLGGQGFLNVRDIIKIQIMIKI